MKKQKKNKYDNFIQYTSLGFEMMAIIGILTFAGYKLDKWMNNEFEGFTLGFMVIAVIIAIIHGTRNLLKK